VSAEVALEEGILSGDDYREVLDWCEERNWPFDFCGMQTRECVDVNECGTIISKPNEIQACYYTENPTCDDGIKNCHDGGCEFLVDCGGPCGPCPTCSDGKQNQGEEGIDCGGPCPRECVLDRLLPPQQRETIIPILIIGILLVSFVVVKFYRVMLLKRESREEKEKKVLKAEMS